MHQLEDLTRVEALERKVRALERALALGRPEKSAREWRRKLRYLVGASVLLALTITGVATGITGATLKEGVRNPSSGYASAETQLLSNNASGYTVRFSNFNVGDGGAQASACRSAIANESCLAVSNLNTGRAFDFYSVGSEAGRIQTGDASGKPFTTNATGVATGLNADKVDGLDAAELQGGGKVEPVRYAANIGAGLSTVFNANGVSVQVDCAAASQAMARSTADNGDIQIVRANTPTPTAAAGVAVAAGDHVVNRDPDMDVNQVQFLNEDNKPAIGTMVFSGAGGGTVSLDYAFDYATPQGDCVFFGTAAISR